MSDGARSVRRVDWDEVSLPGDPVGRWTSSPLLRPTPTGPRSHVVPVGHEPGGVVLVLVVYVGGGRRRPQVDLGLGRDVGPSFESGRPTVGTGREDV